MIDIENIIKYFEFLIIKHNENDRIIFEDLIYDSCIYTYMPQKIADKLEPELIKRSIRYDRLKKTNDPNVTLMVNRKHLQLYNWEQENTFKSFIGINKYLL